VEVSVNELVVSVKDSVTTIFLNLSVEVGGGDVVFDKSSVVVSASLNSVVNSGVAVSPSVVPGAGVVTGSFTVVVGEEGVVDMSNVVVAGATTVAVGPGDKIVDSTASVEAWITVIGLRPGFLGDPRSLGMRSLGRSGLPLLGVWSSSPPGMPSLGIPMSLLASCARVGVGMMLPVLVGN
jgi:hypothetical protein